MKNHLWSILFVLLFVNSSLSAQQTSTALEKWQGDKYSLFIHWGLYSVLGGVWENKPVTRGYSEQIQAHTAGLYSDTYGAIANQFNPIQWNPDSIVLLAKKAGMRSVIITSKHHDGFCMFHSAYTDYNIYDATPYKRDVLKELSDACVRHGLKFGMYFSLIDWHFPQAYPISSHNSDPITPEHHEYNKKQVTELLTNYGKVSEIWFDMGSLTQQQSEDLKNIVKKLQPDCMVSGRLGNDMGDFCVMGDNEYPDYKIETPWQTPASIYDDTWGYRSWQKHGKVEDKAREKLISLIKVVSRGGNYLLNIGPRGDGTVVDFERDVLLTNGKWLETNAEAIYNTKANPFPNPFKWGEVTANASKIYLHLISLPESNLIELPGLTGKVKAVSFIDKQGSQIKVQQNRSGVKIQLPSDLDLNNSIKVIAIEFEKGYSIQPTNVISLNTKDKSLILCKENAFDHYSISGIDYNCLYRSTVKQSWTVKPETTTIRTPRLFYTSDDIGKSIALTVNQKATIIEFKNKNAIPLKNNPAGIQWGPVYLNGPYWCGIGWVNGEVESPMDVNKPWPTEKDKNWSLREDWKDGSLIEVATKMNEGWYLLQEVTSDSEQPYLMGITSGDGIQVFVNGKEQMVHNNPGRERIVQNQLIIHLQKGKNQLLIKYYNRFQKITSIGIDTKQPQMLYFVDGSPVNFKAGTIYEISIQRNNVTSPHADLNLPNLTIELLK